MTQPSPINIVSTDKLFEFIKDIYSNYDCDEDAHKYGNEDVSCRRCKARKLLQDLGLKSPNDKD